ncbi:MAG: HEAT repeat domain-containing protein [Anaerolineae bacterium]|nr:HEAT repeat domain-containing protein [Chloroflexota bacterium]
MALFGPPNIDRLVANQDVPGLIRASEYDRDPDIRRQACEALGLMPDERSLAPLIRRMVDSEFAVREAAARALGQMGDPRAIDSLAAVVESEQEDLSPIAIEALGYIGTEDAVPTLLLCLSDEPLAEVAIEALSRTGAPAVVPLMNIINGRDRKADEKAAASRALHGMDPEVALDLAPLVGDRRSMERFIAARALGELGSEEAISVLVTMLGSTDLQLQPHVLAGLAQIGTNATPALVAALQSESRLQQRSAIDALGRIADPMAAGPLAQVIAGDNPVLRDLALQALARIPDEAALESIATVLHSDSWTARRQVAAALGLAGRRDSIPVLLELLKDSNQTVQRAAASSLSQLGWRPAADTDPAAAASYAVALGLWPRVAQYGEAAVEPLLSILEENAWEQRRQPTEVLASLGDVAVEPCIRALAHADRGVRHSAAFALGRLGDKRAVEPLITLMDDRIEEVRATAARSLGQIGDPAAIQVLGEHLTDVQAVRGPAADALVRMGEAGTPVLLAALDSEDPGVRAIVSDALGDTGSHEAALALIDRLTDDVEAVRQAAVRGLVHLDEVAIEPLYGQLDAEAVLTRVSVAAIMGQIGRPECIPGLYTLVRDSEEAVHVAAAAALEKIWLAAASKAQPLDNVAEMYVMTFTDAPEDEELQAWLISEAFGDLTTARADLQQVHTRIMVDQSLLHEQFESAEEYDYAYGSMYNRYTSWIEAEGGVIEEWDSRFYHREITTMGDDPATHVVFLYYAAGPDEPEEEEAEDGPIDEDAADSPEANAEDDSAAEADADTEAELD